MSNEEKKNKGFAIGGTILFHALAVLILCLTAFRTPLPLPGEEGVEVNLGDSDQGMGEIQTEDASTSTPYTPPQRSSKADEEPITQNNNDNPAIDEAKNNKPKKDTPSEQQQQQQQQLDPRASYHKPNTGGSDGITDQPGNQGKPNGDLTSMNYDGNGGSGNGQGTFNENRGYKHLVTPPNDFTKEGDIAVDVHVDREGRVTNPKINYQKTNISDTKMQQEALDAALRSTYNRDPNGLASERRTIIYHYIKKA